MCLCTGEAARAGPAPIMGQAGCGGERWEPAWVNGRRPQEEERDLDHQGSELPVCERQLRLSGDVLPMEGQREASPWTEVADWDPLALSGCRGVCEASPLGAQRLQRASLVEGDPDAAR